ncbi:hypothetical protein M433DRAFT_138650 [Acidomyces richmondensis BFW]|nr:hypothetical protein M433DRAFT_138650 [Acidomyces richmondensis BFW]
MAAMPAASDERRPALLIRRRRVRNGSRPAYGLDRHSPCQHTEPHRKPCRELVSQAHAPDHLPSGQRVVSVRALGMRMRVTLLAHLACAVGLVTRSGGAGWMAGIEGMCCAPTAERKR